MQRLALRAAIVAIAVGGAGAALIILRNDPASSFGDQAADTTREPAPRITVTSKDSRVCAVKPYVLEGRVSEPARVTVAGDPVEVRDGVFHRRFVNAPSKKLTIEATDRDGATSRTSLKIELDKRPLRGVHVTALAWASPTLRRPIISMARQRLITAVELDLKDESGLIGYDSKLRRARRIGAVQAAYDLERAMKRLNSMCVRVVGRLVAFRDPVLAEAAWRAGKRAQVIQTPGGAPYADYGGFTNFAHPAVRRYNISIAEEAARAGVDDILYDYIRRPDGARTSMRFPGLRGPPARAVTALVQETGNRLERYGTEIGVSVFGIAATRPEQIAQRVPLLARHADYVAPMVYPSHWSPGEYDVADPNNDPYSIVRRSLRDFQRLVRPTGARVVAWLQDFSLGATYGPQEVRAQIEAAESVGVDEWLLWDPEVTYTTEALS